MRRRATLNMSSLDELLFLQLQGIYDAELRSLDWIPLMAEAACCPELQATLLLHSEETESHVTRLEHIFDGLHLLPSRLPCKTMKLLISDGNQLLSGAADDNVRDAIIAAASQRIEHYEIATYGCIRRWAEQLRLRETSDLLQSTLDQEEHAAMRLTRFAQGSICPQLPALTESEWWSMEVPTAIEALSRAAIVSTT